MFSCPNLEAVGLAWPKTMGSIDDEQKVSQAILYVSDMKSPTIHTMVAKPASSVEAIGGFPALNVFVKCVALHPLMVEYDKKVQKFRSTATGLHIFFQDSGEIIVIVQRMLRNTSNNR